MITAKLRYWLIVIFCKLKPNQNEMMMQSPTQTV